MKLSLQNINLGETFYFVLLEINNDDLILVMINTIEQLLLLYQCLEWYLYYGQEQGLELEDAPFYPSLISLSKYEGDNSTWFPWPEHIENKTISDFQTYVLDSDASMYACYIDHGDYSNLYRDTHTLSYKLPNYTYEFPIVLEDNGHYTYDPIFDIPIETDPIIYYYDKEGKRCQVS